MPKNIVIFSDGTGQVGGLKPEQRLSNIYKLYRACRVDPLNDINPSEQICFYDPGLGTDEDAGGFLSWVRFVRKVLGSATGRGIGHNIADCYEFIINNWEPGDKIWLFGFSRGAYTARCVANVLSLCGVPTSESDGKPLKRFRVGTRRIADEAVHKVYEHGAGHPLAEFEDERNELARRFRTQYGSDVDGVPNADPYFIGVFDTVAALGANGWRRVGLMTLIGLSTLVITAIIAWLLTIFMEVNWLTIWAWLALTAGVGILSIMIAKAKRTISNYPKAGESRSHFISWKADNYDRSLSRRVRYARHAISIDETRADFPRVQWGRAGVVRDKESDTDEPLVQLWFAGNHSDIGGSYIETESRLSDIALQWMTEQATAADIPHQLHIDRSMLKLYPSATGMQHCEIQGFANRHPTIAKLINRREKSRKDVLGATLHSSVIERINYRAVLNCGELSPYRPEALAEDERFKHLYS